MDRRDRTFDLGRRLAKRLLPVTVLIGTLIGLGFPAAYYILTLEEWRHEATGLAAELGRHLEPILLENPTLWKYQHPKYQHILENFIIHRNVASVRVLDEGGRPVPGYAYARAAADRWWNARAVVGSAPILFNNRRVGTAQVGLDQRAVLRGTALLFVFSTVVGVGLALVAYFFPVKVVTKQEVQVQDLTETLQQANAELEAKVEERKRAEEALQRNYDTQTVINSLLRFSLEEAPLGDLLHRTLGLILSIPWLAFESQGSIFLVEGEPAVLVMKVQRGLAEAIQKACARVPFGRCLCGRAALAQEIQFADRLDDRHEVTYEGIAPHGHYSAPILYAGRTLGVINVYLQEGHRDDEREREFLAAVANALSGIIERRRAEEALVTRTRQLEAVRAVTAEITRELDLTNLLELILHRVLELVGVANGVLYLWDEAAQVLVPRAWTGQREWLREERLRLGERVVGTVAERRQGMVVNDFRTSPYATPFVLERTTHTAVLAEPLLYRDRLIGVVTMNNEGTGQSFSEQDRETLALFAAQAAIAIENAQLYEAAVRRGEELAALLQASRSVMSGLDLQGILKRIVAEAAQIARTPHIKVVLVDRETQTLRIVAAAGRPTEMLADFRHPLGSGLSGLVATRGEPLFVPNCQDDPRNFGADQDRALGIQTYLGLPIKSRNEVIGVLTFNTTEPREYTPQELDYLTSFADQAAIALENARLYAASEGRATALETLREIGQAITSRLELPAVLEAVVMGAMRLLNNPFAQIILWDEQSQRLRYGAANGPEAERVRNQSFELGRGINGTVAQIRQPMVLDDYQASPYVVPECFDIVATITVPILFGDRLLGVLHSHTTEPGRRFTSDDLRRFQMLAAQAAIAIENARLHEATLRQLTELKALRGGRA